MQTPHTHTHSYTHPLTHTLLAHLHAHTYSLLLQVDGPEYFQHPAGYIIYDPALPAALLDAAKNVNRAGNLAATQPHFDLVNYQLTQMRVAFALAQVRGVQWGVGGACSSVQWGVEWVGGGGEGSRRGEERRRGEEAKRFQVGRGRVCGRQSTGDFSGFKTLNPKP